MGPRMLELKIKRLDPEARLPTRSYEHSVGWDLYAHIRTESGRLSKKLLPARSTVVVLSGIAIEPPEGYFVMVCSRSGLAKHSVFVANAPGIVDPDYRGDVSTLLYNGGTEAQYVSDGDRIAQLVLIPAQIVRLVEHSDLSTTVRGDKGFGSTGGFNARPGT